jgi:tRNA U54 and U55 pseudouridine synthase Pus10
MTSQKLFNNFAKEINIKLDPLREQLGSVNNRLANIKQNQPADVATTAAQLQHDREIASKKMETAVKLAMEMAGRAYLKEQKEKAGSQLIL